MAFYVYEDGRRVLVSREEYEDLVGEVPLAEFIAAPQTKPDGTLVDIITETPSNAKAGSAFQRTSASETTTGQTETGATFTPGLADKIEQDPTKTGMQQLTESTSSSPGNPPFENILEQFSTFNALWTLAALEPNQYNNPSSYRDNFQSVKNIVFSSAGRYDDRRTPSFSGTPEYYVNDFILNAKPLPLGDGNTNVVGFSFTVYEPYSMGLFLQTLQAAAVSAGYSNYLENVPYLLKLDFIGNTDNGDLKNAVTAFSRYFTVKLTSVNQKVNESGSNYSITAVPFHHIGYGDLTNLLRTDERLVGGTVEEVLTSGSESLTTHLNKVQEKLVKEGHQSLPDVYEVVFPKNASDSLGISTSTTGSFSLSATINPTEIVSSVLSKATAEISTNFGGNSISSSTMNFDASVGGKFSQPKEDETIDSATGVTDRSKVRTDPTKREFNFTTGERITNIIQKVILVSQYAGDAVDAENLDKNGLAKWFRIDLQIQLLDYDVKRAVRAKKYTYRVLPYKVDGALIKNPSAPTPGLEKRKETICKRYDYIYSGQNNNILDLNLEFNTMFYTAGLPHSPDKTGTNNPDTQVAADSPQTSTAVNEGNTSVTQSDSGAPQVGPDEATVKSSPTGQKSILSQIADVFQERFKNSSADMVNITMEVMGDPYFLADSGINSNYFSSPGVNSQITGDNALAYEDGDIFVYIAFRTPIEPNLSVSNQGGLYDFADNGGVSPYSGIYRITNIENKFNDGKFTQILTLLRVLGQSNDFVGQENIVKQNVSLYKKIFSIPSKSSPASDLETDNEQGEETSPGGLDGLLDTVSGAVGTVTGAVGTVTGIINNVSSGNIAGAFSSVSTITDSLAAARANQRPTSQTASAAPQTTGSLAASPASSEPGPDPRLLQGRPDFTSNIPEIRRRAGLD